MTVVSFLRSSFDKELGELITELDRMRKKRHVSVYDTTGAISQSEMRHALKVADEFHEKVRSLLQPGASHSRS